jgi:hypothetical protein
MLVYKRKKIVLFIFFHLKKNKKLEWENYEKPLKYLFSIQYKFNNFQFFGWNNMIFEH